MHVSNNAFVCPPVLSVPSKSWHQIDNPDDPCSWYGSRQLPVNRRATSQGDFQGAKKLDLEAGKQADPREAWREASRYKFR